MKIITRKPVIRNFHNVLDLENQKIQKSSSQGNENQDNDAEIDNEHERLPTNQNEERSFLNQRSSVMRGNDLEDVNNYLLAVE